MSNLAIAFTFSGVLILLTCTPLMYMAFARSRSRAARAFGLELACVSMWGVTTIIIGMSRAPEAVAFAVKWCMIFIYFIPVFFHHTIYILVRKRYKLLLIFSYVQAIFFSLLTAAGLIVSQPPVRYHFNSFYFINGTFWYTLAFISWLIVTSVAHAILIIHHRKMYPRKRAEYLGMILASGLGFGGGSMNFLPGMGVEIFPWGNYLVSVYFVIISFIVLRYNFLDITVVLQKGMVYSVLLAGVSVCYLLAVFTMEKFLQAEFGYSSMVVSFAAAFSLGVLFIPLKDRIQRFLDRNLFKGTLVQMAEENAVLKEEVVQKEKYREVATLASGIAHEVRNPVTALKTFFDFLPEMKQDKEFLKRFEKIGKKEVGRIEQMVTELLDYARPAPPRLKSTNINKIIKDVVGLAKGRMSKTMVDIELNLMKNNNTIQIDKGRIEQAVLNILFNAIEAMPDGGKIIVSTSTTPEPKIKRPFNGNGRYLEISIADNGPGLTPEQIKHIYEPFYTNKKSGTGLGLSVTKSIIDQHKGKIEVVSEKGRGACFKIKLPMAKNHEPKKVAVRKLAACAVAT